jgi:hypothetical protein
MVSRNDITNDKIQTKGVLSKEGEDNWDRIFGKRIKEQKLSSEDLQSLKDVIVVTTETRNVNATDQDIKVDTSFDYEYELNKSTGEVERKDL